MSDYKDIEKRFLEDVSLHEMQVIKDDGVNRHLRFTKKDSSIYYFDIITFYGNLLINGDCGSYLFARTEDMFDFFTNKPDNYPELYINPSYWGEKLQAISRHGGYKEFSNKLAEEYIEQEFNYFKENCFGEFSDEDFKLLWEDIENNLINLGSLDYHTLNDYMFTFENGETFQFNELWDYNFEEFTHSYIWNCYAIVWGINKYLKEKINNVYKNL